MPFNGAGIFNRIYSWVADAAAGINISSSRMDTDTNDIATAFNNCLTRDGQGQPTANLPMAGFRHTGASNGAAVNDYTTMGQTLGGLINWAVAGGSADVLTATYAPALTSLVDGQLCFVRSTAANATTTPTFAPNGLTAHAITKAGGAALGAADISGALTEIILRYNLANARWELLNPSLSALSALIIAQLPSTGDMKLTYKAVADTGWLLFDDTTIGSGSSIATHASADYQALFTLLWNNVSSPSANAYCIVGGGLGASAAADWAAAKTLQLPKSLGRSLAISGTGSGLTARTLAQTIGEETHLLTTPEIPAHTHVNTLTDPQHNHTTATGATVTVVTAAGASVLQPGGANTGNSATGVTITNAAAGGGGTHNNMQPTTFLNAMIKV